MLHRTHPARSPRRPLLAGAALLVALTGGTGLAACGSDSEAPDPTTTTVAEDTPTDDSTAPDGGNSGAPTNAGNGETDEDADPSEAGNGDELQTDPDDQGTDDVTTGGDGTDGSADTDSRGGESPDDPGADATTTPASGD